MRPVLLHVLILFGLGASAQTPVPGNRPERLEWFRDAGFGLFIHWSLDSQLGSVISHSMVGADDDYLRRFVDELPRTFLPRKFHPADWAALAKLAGVRYVVFTTKHHSGFCMFETATTPFGVMNTPFRRDITRDVFDAFRAQGIAAGIYFSPDDFWWLYKNGKTLQRGIPGVQPRTNPGLMEHDKAQVRELLTQYGSVDVIFFDGEAEGLRELAWDLQPGIVVTRGAMLTPEQYVPGVPIDEPWESCITMGTQWQYKPTNEKYKSGGELISLLIETRAKGGNLLLNVGPNPDGELPIEQDERLREIALWMFINGESIYGVRPWVVTNEGPYWFTKKKDEDTVYVFVKPEERWKYGEWRDIVLKSVRVTQRTKVSVLSQNDRVLEYRPDVVPATTFAQKSDGLHIRAMRAQRIYNDRKWPNPVVLKLTHVEAALRPPRVETLEAEWNSGQGTAALRGEVKQASADDNLRVGFEYRDITGQDVLERNEPWVALPLAAQRGPGPYTKALPGLSRGRTYEFRAVVEHPMLKLYGAERRLTVP